MQSLISTRYVIFIESAYKNALVLLTATAYCLSWQTNKKNCFTTLNLLPLRLKCIFEWSLKLLDITTRGPLVYTVEIVSVHQ